MDGEVKKMEKTVTKEDENIRLDQWVMSVSGHSRNRVQKMMEQGLILVNGKKGKNSYRVKEQDHITIGEYQEEPMNLDPVEMNLKIVYEDEDVLVVDKENGVVVHPAPGNPSHTLVNGLLYHAKDLSDVNGEFRPGIVHRIDAYTTGLLMVAKNNEAHHFLAKQLSEKTTHRKYIALVWGVITHDTGTIDAPIGRDPRDRKKQTVTSQNSKHAITHFKVLERYSKATLIECVLETGRTHQIRVHMNYIGHPIVNDPVYGKRPILDDSGQCLHASELGFVHPRTHQYMEFHSELPECFVNILNQFKDS